MKRLLTAATLAAVIGCAQRAHAVITVEDIATEVGISKETVETVRNGLTQIQQLQTELQSLQQYVYMGENLIHSPNLGTVMGLANQLGIAPNLPINPYALMSLTSGYGGMNSLGGIVGKLSQLGSLTNGAFNADHVYTCVDQSFACQQSQATASANAGAKGAISQVYTDMADHLTVLQGLRTRLASASDPKTVQDVTAQIGIEQGYVQTQQANMTAVVALADVQRRVTDQQANEKYHSDLNAILASAPDTN